MLSHLKIKEGRISAVVHLDNHQSSHKQILSSATPALKTKQKLLTGCKTAGKPSFQTITPKRTDSTILSLAAKTAGKCNWTGCNSCRAGFQRLYFKLSAGTTSLNFALRYFRAHLCFKLRKRSDQKMNGNTTWFYQKHPLLPQSFSCCFTVHKIQL